MDIGSNENHTNIVPVVYALLPDKTKRTYIRLFEALKRELSLDIDFFKCDYEVGQYKAFRMVFPQAKLTGCYFHFNKNVWDKGEEMNLTSTKEGRHAVRLTANLPLIPTACIADAWINIIQITPDTDEMRDFHWYVNKQWLSLPMISCAKERHRTTNSVEAWHRRLNSRVARKPTFVYFLQKIREESKIQDIKLCKNIFNVNNRKKVDIKFDTEYTKLLTALEEGLITPFDFLEKVTEVKKYLKIYKR